MNTEHYLFVSCPFGGTEVFMKNLRRYVEGRTDISGHWLEIPRLVPSDSQGLGKITGNWSLRASALTFLAIRELHRRGITIKAAFFNHLTAVSLLLWYRRKIPCVLSLDTTPVLLNRDREWYRRGTFQTRGIAERLSQRWTRRTYSAMRYLLPWSEYAKNSLVVDYGVAADRAIVMPPGIDLSIWKPDDRATGGHRGQLSVLFVGGDFVRKGGDVLLQLAGTEGFQDMEFHFVTSSVPGPTPRNAHVYSGVQPNSDILLKLYRESDVFVLPTRADYAPTNAVVEAFAAGLPVVTTNVGGLGDLIHERENGFIIPRSDTEILGQRLKQLQTDPVLLREMKVNAREFAERNFDNSKNGSEIIDLLRKM